ncbi:MAG: bifunctional phosphopantothenoylcysteine decarboxylase/phosphopantothenate--cysteine ligase CoaBC [Desulfuromonas sp.]|nr:MAG: bifunctional phosphopantothenoylcysteine decarboxylase/phosphopantothenate--cysteine ligase CoaBC [Desulfuromonas sp.]
MLQGKRIVLGISGGIAAYKGVELLRLLVKAGAEVHVIMTRNAQEFVTPLTFQTLSGNPVHTDLFNLYQEQEIGHISLADRADLLVIAPATANLVGKIAGGIADDLLTTTIMATKAPVLFAPAMNVNMWENPIYQRNQQTLTDLGYHFLAPVRGELACGWEGEGKLPDPQRILDECRRCLTPQRLAGRKVVVTAGPTREEIDPVRYLSNHSSGKMGYAIAAAAWRHGADVTLVSGPCALAAPAGVRLVAVDSAVAMRKAVLDETGSADIVVKAAAVADYRPKQRASQKMKKGNDGPTPPVELVRNPDILAELGEGKRDYLLVGFAAETNDLEENARAKLQAKNCDLLVANDVSAEGCGFEVDTNQVTVFSKDGRNEKWPCLGKDEVAERLIDLFAGQLGAAG